MNIKFKISISVSLALAVFFALPWISLFDQAQHLQQLIPQDIARKRLFFLVIMLFSGSMLFFQVNFYWRSAKLLTNAMLSQFAQATVNLLLIILIAGFSHRASIRLLDIDASTTFISLHLIRYLGVAVISLLVTYAYDVLERSRLDRINLLTVKNEKMATELNALKAQIDPHFLFNSLNTLTGVIRVDPKQAIKFVGHLSETMRYTLDHKDSNLVTLRQEIEYLESYEFMMKIRFKEGFRIDNQIEVGSLDRQIPQFALQLLVENAIKHNVVSQKRPLVIRISSSNGKLIVANNLQLKASMGGGYGIGLSNLSKRYELLNMDPIEINKTEKAFLVTLSLL